MTSTPGSPGTDLLGAADTGPAPLLAAFDRYRGAWTDLTAGRRFEADELREGARAAARTLREKGVRAGDRAVLSVANSPMLPALMVALLELGASPVFVHTETPPEECGRIAARAGAGFVLSQKLDPARLAAVCGPAERVEVLPWLGFALARPTVSERPADGPHGVLLHPTSGTTGVPKLAVRTAAAAVADGHAYLATLPFGASDVFMATSPMTHVYAHGMALVVPLLTDADVVVAEKFHPRVAGQAITDLGVTVLPAVPAMLEALLAAHPDPRRLPELVFTAGAPLVYRLARQYREATGHWPRPLYGTTETGLISVARSAEEAAEPDTVGSPAASVDLRLAPSRRSPDLDTFLVRSPALLSGYLAADGTVTDVLEDGWYRTGDLGRAEAGGTFRLRGRESEIINVGGLKVVPIEVEEVIDRLPEVAAVKVYGRVAADKNEKVSVAVVAKGTLTPGRIAAHCKEHLVYYKRPTAIHILDALPRTASGKVLVAELP
ncbi:class I adenylate-forming enzyme family protein [Nocardia takedensis]